MPTTSLRPKRHTRLAPRETPEAHQALEDHFDSLQFRNPILPGTTVAGFVLTNRDESVKTVDVDLIAREDAKNFTFYAVDPTFKATRLRVDFEKLYASDELLYAEDEDELRTLLEQLPCCVKNANGTDTGDPLNLVLVPMRSTPTSTRSTWRTFRAFFGGEYKYAGSAATDACAALRSPCH